MTVTTARKRFWNDWHQFKESNKKRGIEKFVTRMKKELGYNIPTQIEVERLMRQEVSSFQS